MHILQLQVNNTGYLFFGAAWLNLVPTAFPFATNPLVAPYLADVDTTGTGSVWYRSTQNATLLAKAVNDTQALFGTFSPQWLFIATWDRVGYNPSGTDKVGNVFLHLFKQVVKKILYENVGEI